MGKCELPFPCSPSAPHGRLHSGSTTSSVINVLIPRAHKRGLGAKRRARRWGHEGAGDTTSSRLHATGRDENQSQNKVARPVADTDCGQTRPGSAGAAQKLQEGRAGVHGSKGRGGSCVDLCTPVGKLPGREETAGQVHTPALVLPRNWDNWGVAEVGSTAGVRGQPGAGTAHGSRPGAEGARSVTPRGRQGAD